MKLLKILYLFSVLGTIGTLGSIVHAVTYGNFLNLIFLTPILTILYPIALFGTGAYLLKKYVKQIGITDLMDMTVPAFGDDN